MAVRGGARRRDLALLSLLAGDSERALSLVIRSYLSAFAVLLLAGTTSLPSLLRGMERLGAPRMVILVIQFLYRYLFVISNRPAYAEAALCRGGRGAAPLASRLRAAAGAVSVLFGRSYQRAEGIHRAMLARLYQGHLVLASPARTTWWDLAFLCGLTMILLALRFPFWMRLWARH
jgi:cobalt/nickel transport system permease protein